MYDDIWKILLPAIFTLIGVMLGNYLIYKNSYNFFIRQKTFENQRVSFARIMSLKVPWTQSIRTNLEAKILSEFYERRSQLFLKNIDDLNESKRQNDRALALIKDISGHQRETFETLGLIQISFSIDPELQNAIDDLFNYKGLDIEPFPPNFNSEDELELHKTKALDRIQPSIEREFLNKFDKLITILKSKLLKTAKPKKSPGI